MGHSEYDRYVSSLFLQGVCHCNDAGVSEALEIVSKINCYQAGQHDVVGSKPESTWLGRIVNPGLLFVRNYKANYFNA